MTQAKQLYMGQGDRETIKKRTLVPAVTFSLLKIKAKICEFKVKERDIHTWSL